MQVLSRTDQHSKLRKIQVRSVFSPGLYYKWSIFVDFIIVKQSMSVRHKHDKTHKLTKRDQDVINRFAYYSDNLQEAALHSQQHTSHNETTHTNATFGNNEYHSFQLTRDSFNHQCLLDLESLTQLAKEYLQPLSNTAHLQSNPPTEFERAQTGSLPVQFVEILIVQEKKKENYSDKYFQKSDKSAITISSSADIKEPYNLAVYVVHRTNESQTAQPSWNYFVEKICLQADPYSKSDKSFPVTYELILSFPKESWIQSNLMRWFRPPQHQKQMQSILHEARQRLDLFQSYLAKNLTKKAQQELHQSQNCHPEFKREDKLPAEHYKKFQKLKTQTYSYYSTINRNKKLNRYFLDNLVCRYMINKKYDQNETLSALKKYLDWQKMMRNKYSLEYFKQFQQMGIFQYVGKDFQGRPLILFNSDNFIPEKIHNELEYIDYNAYIFQIYIQDQMEGYIDEYSIIGDYRGFSTANFKYSIAKGFSELSNQYFPERQNKLIIFGLNSFGEWIYKVIKPILPSFIIQKIFIFGQDFAPFEEQIKNFMDPKIVIPLLEKKSNGKKK